MEIREAWLPRLSLSLSLSLSQSQSCTHSNPGQAGTATLSLAHTAISHAIDLSTHCVLG